MASKDHAIQIGTAPGVLRTSKLGDYFIACLLVVGTIVVFLILNDKFEHWFVLPLILCGVLTGVDVVQWARGRLDAFDPQTVVGLVSFYGLFMAPLLHVAWDRFGAGYDFVLRADWRIWLGGMALLNAGGLILYRAALAHTYRRTSPNKTFRQIDSRRLLPVFSGGLALSITGLLFLYTQMGGISGIISAYESSRESFIGKGWLLVLAWPATILSVIGLTLLLSSAFKSTQKNLYYVLFVLAAAGISHFLLVGWHGSRSATVWAVFWMAGIMHYRFHELTTRTLMVGLVVLVAFMYFYGFYKEQGRQGIEVLRAPTKWANPAGYRRDLRGMFLGDLARADGTAYILHNLSKYPEDYDYRWGLTYAGAFTILIPKELWPDRPKFKVQAGTEAQYGKRTHLESSRVYGLNGEALLNFGPSGVPVLFALYGAALGWYRKKLLYWHKGDARLLLAPFFTILFVTGFVGDSDNLVFGATIQGALATACIFLSSRTQPLPGAQNT